MLSLVKIDPVVLNEDCLNFVDVFLLFHSYDLISPLENGIALKLNKFEFPYPFFCFWGSLVKIG